MKDLEVLAGWNFSPNLGIQCIFSFNYFFFSSIVRTVLFHGNLLLNPIGFRLYFSPIYFFPPMNEELQVQFSSVTQSCPTVCDPWNAAHQASLSITNSRSPPKPMSIELVMPSNHLILCRPLLLCPQSFPASGSFPVSQLFASGSDGQEDFLSSSYFKREFLIHLFIFSSSSKRIFNN